MSEQPPVVSLTEARMARSVGRASRELFAIGASITAGYGGNWLAIAAAPARATADIAVAGVPSADNTANSRAGAQNGGSAVENHPSTPAPGPGPGGAGGGAAAAGGSGSAFSISFTLVGALLQAAPRAMRRFRLAQPSWRTSFFVLIPERPD